MVLATCAAARHPVPWGAAVAGCRPQAALAPRPVLAAPRQRRQAARRQAHIAAAGSDLGTSLATTAATPDYNLLQQHKVFSAATGAEVALTSEWQAAPGTRCVVALLTHFGDLSSTELAQKLMAILPELQASGVRLLAVGLGETAKARRFAELLGFPLDLLYADPSGELYRALGFSPGFAPDVKISAYAKLLPMLAGIGSPGTIQEVLRGYTGDRSAKPVFVATRGGTTDGTGSGVSGTVDGTVGGGGVAGGAAEGGGSLFDVLGKDYQRPFELATLRLFNMGLVLSHWNELAPADERLLTQQGGCLVFDDRRVLYRHADTGILRYAPVEQLAAAALPSGAAAAATQTLRTLL
ncbi:hypothetical protein D9Q98_006999 [Chlorella vulgaris]|uniref:Uncharacterized protein n=1 Tax=Chlorella vulgaris TaxID=3077 RepID=A0A9D4TJC4_CHLVU|nr:hypothetical protein D9Q98_006999 [Chlorella vulgaris]